MITNDFLVKLLESNFEEMTIEELTILDKYDSIFGLGKKYTQLLESLKKKDTDEKRSKVVDYINEKIPLKYFILNRLDNYAIYEPNVIIDFKTAFHRNLDKMDAKRLCYLVDRISKLNSKYHINIFGHRSNEAIAYHKINEVVCGNYSLTLVFSYFYRDAPRRFQHLPFFRLDRDKLAQRLKEYCVLYFPILEGVSEYILNTKEEDLESRKELLKMNKILKPYFEIIEREHKVLSGDSKKRDRSWKFLIENEEVADKDFGGIEENDA